LKAIARRFAIVAMASMLGVIAPGTPRAAGPIVVHAAGSLRSAFTAIASAFIAEHPGHAVRLDFGPSGLLKDRLLAAPGGGVFASANMEHPDALARAGRAGPVRAFARNMMCALVRPGFDVTTATLVEHMLDPATRLGTSTPKTDPSGDYAWELFARIEKSGVAGARARLEAKALQLVGGPTAPPPDPRGRSADAALVADGNAHNFLTYCTNATLAVQEERALRVVALPQALQVGAQYGVTVLAGSDEAAHAFVDFLLGSRGQALLANAGFAAP
jgi:ABC-type molybdate transport system substrate-binding protein